jgi:hypothetical protein
MPDPGCQDGARDQLVFELKPHTAQLLAGSLSSKPPDATILLARVFPRG